VFPRSFFFGASFARAFLALFLVAFATFGFQAFRL
jgi:hypothetical protein